MRFGSSPADQAQAHLILSTMYEGQLEREAGKPLYIDKDGKPVYRVLLCGLKPWVKYDISAYGAQDGPGRQFSVGRKGRTWECVLYDSTEKGSFTKVIPVAEGLPSMRAARAAAEEYARRMVWVKGAPW